MLRRFQKSGFGVTLAVLTSVIALCSMTQLMARYIVLHGASCGTERGGVVGQFYLWIMFLPFTLIGLALSCRADYGVRVSRCALVATGVAGVLLSMIPLLF